MKMKILFLLMLVVILPCYAGDEAAVKKNAQDLMQAFNNHDAEKIASLWAKNATFFHPLTGEISEGREEITAYYKKQFASGAAIKAEIIVDSVIFEGDDKATETGLFRISFADKSKAPEQSAFKAHLIKEEGKWVMQSVTDMKLEPAPSQFVHLQEIDWMVGEWVDKDQNIEITFNTKWDKTKNFLTQRFTSNVLGQTQIEGQQIIAWDPIEKRVRSWVFDSDGGFGSGFWTKKDKSWYANMSYTLPEGRKASATLIYTKIDDNAYTFASIGRDVDGEVLPDIDPVTVVRK